MHKAMETWWRQFIHNLKCFQGHSSHSTNLQGRHLCFFNTSQQLNIKRLGPYLNRLNKLTIFLTFIHSNFCTEKNSKKIEKVQERALRFVYEDYNSSCDNLLKKAKVPSLQIRRMRTMALGTFKIMNKLSPSCLHNLVDLWNSKYYFRYNNILDIRQVRTSRYGKTTFKFAAAT
jgi:hypothetical protein